MSFRTRLYARLMEAAKRGASRSFARIPTRARTREPVPTASFAVAFGIPVDMDVATTLPPSETLPLRERVGVAIVEVLQRLLPNRERKSRWVSRQEVDLAIAVVIDSEPGVQGLWPDYDTDAAFARQIVQGPTAPILERRGSEFVVDTTMLAGLPRWPGTSPLGVLTVIDFGSDGEPHPVRIELEGGEIVRPVDGERWRIAKLVAAAAMQTWVVVGPHLMHTHFLTAGALATLCLEDLPPDHAVRLLMAPHILGTLAVNHRAGRTLLGPHGNVQAVYSFPWPSVQTLVARAIAAFDPVQFDPPMALRARGLTEIAEAGHYPYGQDALLLWEAIHAHTQGWIAAAYADDAALRSDADLSRFLARAPRFIPGGIPASSRTELSRSLARMIFAVTGHHKLVGGISLEFLTHPYFMPHRVGEGTTVEAVVPWREETEANLAAKYGTTYRTWRLVADWSHFMPDAASGARMAQFQSALHAVGATIDERNRSRRWPFPHLHPDGLESSVAV